MPLRRHLCHIDVDLTQGQELKGVGYPSGRAVVAGRLVVAVLL
jgi:hypothetical protein